MSWNQINSLYYKKDENFKFKEKILAFDFDGTLFDSLNNNKFPLNKDDLKIKDQKIFDKILKYSKEYCIIVISNQGGISKNKITLQEVKEKLDFGMNYLRKMGLSIMICFSSDYDNYRKPHTGIWNEILTQSSFHNTEYMDNNLNNPYEFIYVGDAAGRIKTKTFKKDFSDSDRMFAYNIKAKFITPEEYIGLLSREWKWSNDFYPLKNNFNTNKEIEITIGKKPEIIIMVGYPGSGKSTLSYKLSQKFNYNIVNNDSSKSFAKTKKEFINNLSQNKSVIIDNTNSSKKNRKVFIELAKNYKYNIRCIWIQCSLQLSYHLNQMRTEISGKKSIPKVAYYTFRKYFEEPTLDEGINEIIPIQFILDKNKIAFWRYYN